MWLGNQTNKPDFWNQEKFRKHFGFLTIENTHGIEQKWPQNSMNYPSIRIHNNQFEEQSNLLKFNARKLKNTHRRFQDDSWQLDEVNKCKVEWRRHLTRSLQKTWLSTWIQSNLISRLMQCSLPSQREENRGMMIWYSNQQSDSFQN